MLRLIAIELILFCALFTMMVKTAVWNSALNGLYFYVTGSAADIGTGRLCAEPVHVSVYEAWQGIQSEPLL